MSTLAVHGLTVAHGERRLVDGVSFSLDAGRVVALVGASGSGKSMTLRGLLDLAPTRPGRVAGTVTLDGRPASAAEVRRHCGLLLQDARAALDPLRTVGDQVRLAALHAGATVDAPALLRRLGLGAAAGDAWPHELSGGMAQRAALAVALARRSTFLLCDEPTSALVAHLQVELVQLLRELDGVGVLLLTHDLRLLPGLADEVLVMEAGAIVDRGPSLAALRGPGRALVEATARIAGPAFAAAAGLG